MGNIVFLSVKFKGNISDRQAPAGARQFQMPVRELFFGLPWPTKSKRSKFVPVAQNEGPVTAVRNGARAVSGFVNLSLSNYAVGARSFRRQ